MKLRGRPAIRKRANRVNKSIEFEQKRAKSKDAEDEENSTSTGSSSRGKKNVFELSFSESESEESIQEKSGRKSQRLNVSVSEMDSEDGIESIDLFDEEKSDSEERQELGSRRSSRISPRKQQPFDSTDESDTDYFSDSENVKKSNGDTEKEASPLPRSSRSKDKKDTNEVDKTEAYIYLQTVLVPLEDIGGLLQSHSNGKLTKDWTFSVRRSKKINRPSSSSYEIDMSSNSDLDDDDDDEFILSESSASDSEDSTSSSGSNFSWESDCDSISSSNSWLPRRRISSSEEDSTSDELEEIEDDFVLHSDKKRRDLRKRKYALRQISTAIRSKVAKYCDESNDENIDSSD